MTNLVDIHLFSIVDLLNVVLNRISALSLDSFSYYDSISASIFQDMALKFFSEPPPTLPSISPLSTLSPHQAVYLINMFFTVNPNSIILNQTLILQGYWTDSIDPLLLCVIYGTTTYMQKMVNGQPLGLWEAADQMLRNPFLEYAYILLQKSSSEISLEKYQAVVLLGCFEVVFGFPKRGLVTLGLGFMIGINLGIWDGTFQEESNDIRAELATYTFWCTFNSACRGVVDLGQVPHYAKKTLSLKLPPANIEQSVSYQFEKSSGNPRGYSSFDFLVESFYTHSVCCKYTVLLLLEFPEVRHNMFFPRLKRSQAGLRSVGYPKPDDLGARLQKVIQNFEVFIQETKHTWSPSQVYTLESLCTLYDIHIIFIKNSGPLKDGINFSNSAYEFLQDIRLLPNDPATMVRIQAALPKVYRVMDKTHDFLSDPANYDNKPSLLPRGLVVSVLETAIEVIFIQLSSDPWDETSFDYLKMVEGMTQRQDIWTDWSAIGSVQAKINTFFDGGGGYGSTASMMTMIPGFLDENIDQLTTTTATVVGSTPSESFGTPSTMTTDDDLACAAFLDPCGTWLNPMRNSVVDLRLLSGISEPTPPPQNDITLRIDYIPDYYSNNIQPLPNGSNTDLMGTAFLTELDALEGNQGHHVYSNNKTQPSPPQPPLPPSSEQYDLANNLAIYPLGPATELFIPSHYSTSSGDGSFV
ncbi:unnamed protein product [Absidia cylindrospora]